MTAQRKRMPPTFWATVWTDDPADGMVVKLEEQQIRNVHNLRSAMQKAAALVGEMNEEGAYVVEVRVRKVNRP